MINIPDRIEGILSRSAALYQKGRLRSTVHIHGKTIFLVNSDNTVIMKFLLHGVEAVFPEPISFRASDYSGAQIVEKDGRIYFVKDEKENPWICTKSCGIPDVSFSDVSDAFDSLDIPTDIKISVDTQILSRVEESLSHIEIVGRNGNVLFLQRDIYSGAVFQIHRRKEKGFISAETVPDFGPVGIRTSDFIALLEFSPRVLMYFNTDDNSYFMVRDPDKKEGMLAMVAGCQFDDMGTINYVHQEEYHGREEQENGGSVEDADSETDRPKVRKRTRDSGI
jgi:hypothetical protein